MSEVFLAYASGNDFHETIIRESAQAASSNLRSITPWSEKDTSGQEIRRSVETWIAEADAFVADISYVNMNVTYEVGYAVGLKKPVRLIRSENCNFATVQDVGLLSSLGHDKYDYQPKLTRILGWRDVTPSWPKVGSNKEQPIFVLYPPLLTDAARRGISAIKKVARYKFRGFNPAEISRLTAGEAYEQTLASFGVVVFWSPGDRKDDVQNNQRASFIFGLARGLEIPAILVAHKKDHLPLDFVDSAVRWDRPEDLDDIISTFRDEVADKLVNFSSDEGDGRVSKLSQLHFGDPIAENEQSYLSSIFVETDAFDDALSGDAHVLVGRKGSGKSAIFLRVRDRVRGNKNNIVVDLMPEGHQLIKLKEFVLDKLSYGNRKEVISAFWQYVLWLEIAYKILEKDFARSRRDHEVLIRYEELERIFRRRVDTGEGDFSERLRILADNIIERFDDSIDEKNHLKSSQLLQVVYGQDIVQLRENVLSYLTHKGNVLFLFDNLDRIWTPGGFTNDDAVILVGLAEAMQELSRRFAKAGYKFNWTLFIRSDVYEFLIAGMADYGKLSHHSIEWTDRHQLISLFNRRLISSVDESPIAIEELSVTSVEGKKVVEFLIDGCLMRPRYLIRLFETARRRAITLKKKKIDGDDYAFARIELGWQCLEDLDREIVDLVPEGTNILFDVTENRVGLTPDKLRYIAGKSIESPEEIERLIDVMIWSGCLGVRTGSGVKYIFNSGYKRQYLSSLIKNGGVALVIHPTLVAALES